MVEVGSGLRGQWKVGERVTAQPFIGCGHCPDWYGGAGVSLPEGAMRASAELPGAYAEYTGRRSTTLRCLKPPLRRGRWSSRSPWA